MWFHTVWQEISHRVPANKLREVPWQMDIYIPLRQVMVTQKDGRPVKYLPKNKETCHALRSLFHSDSTCPECQKTLTVCSCEDWRMMEADTTFHPKEVLKKRLEKSDWSQIDRMYHFGRGGSPFCGFPVVDDTGCLSSLLHVAWFCKPLFTGVLRHEVTSEKENYCTLLQGLGEASNRNTQQDIVTKLMTKYSARESTVPLQERESRHPVEMLTAWLEDFDKDYVDSTIGVKVEETMETTPYNKKTRQHVLMSIEGHESGSKSGSLEEMMKSDEHKFSVQGEFFWVQIGMDCSTFSCEPRIRTGPLTYYLLGFLSHEERDGKYRWLATIRDDCDRYFIMDHHTCEPVMTSVTWLGVTNARLLLYGIKKLDPPTWLRQPSLTAGVSSKRLDCQALAKDGLVTGSVRDLVRQLKSPNLQSELQKGVAKVLDKLAQSRQVRKGCQSASHLDFVQGWPMPQRNQLSLVYNAELPKHQRPTSTRSTAEFGDVRLQSSVTCSNVKGFHLLVCSIYDVGVFSKYFLQWIVSIFFFRHHIHIVVCNHIQIVVCINKMYVFRQYLNTYILFIFLPTLPRISECGRLGNWSSKRACVLVHTSTVDGENYSRQRPSLVPPDGRSSNKIVSRCGRA